MQCPLDTYTDTPTGAASCKVGSKTPRKRAAAKPNCTRSLAFDVLEEIVQMAAVALALGSALPHSRAQSVQQANTPYPVVARYSQLAIHVTVSFCD